MPRAKKSTTKPARKKTTRKVVSKPAKAAENPDLTRLTDDPTAPLGYHLLATARSYGNALQAALSAKPSTSKLTVPRLQALQLIAANEGISGADLARALGVTPQTVTTIVNNLAAYGWIERRPGHGRSIEAHLTPAGRAQMNKGLATLAKVDAELANTYSHDGAEATVLTDLLSLGRLTLTPQAA